MLLLAACEDAPRPHCSAEVIHVDSARADGCTLELGDKLCFYCNAGECPVPRGPQDTAIEGCGQVRVLQRTVSKRCGQHTGCKRLLEWKR